MKGFLRKLGFIKQTKQTSQNINQSGRRIAGIFAVIGLVLFCLTILTFTIRGSSGNPTPDQLNTLEWKDNGPLELSPERGRYALLYSLVEDKSFTFSTDIAKFSAPDVGYLNGKYVSLFAPGVSFMVIPGYYLGKMFGLAQVGSFAVIALFAICNFFLIRAIAKILGANSAAASIGAVAFLFASPAFAYAVTLYQHHISTFLILLSVFLLMRFNSFFSLLAIWVLCGLSIAVDYPNFFMMLPVGIFALGRTISVKRKEQIVKLSVPFLRVFAISAIALPLFFFLWFNTISYGSPMTLSGSVERAIEIKQNGTPLLESEVLKKQLEASNYKNVDISEKNIGAFFNPRNLINGFYTHFISLDRGMIFYAPVMLFGVAGLLFYRKRSYLSLFVSIIGFNVILYSMWSDPYGGWAFGSRYLIPTYAILGIFTAVLLSKLNKQILFLMMFFFMLTYSISVNTLGAITSNRNPPQIEILDLEKRTGTVQPYTFVRNMQMLDQNIAKSYVYQTYFKDSMAAWDYYLAVTGFIVSLSAVLIISLAAPALSKKKEHKLAAAKVGIVTRRKELYAI